MRKPIIGISSSMIIDKDSDVFAGYERTYTNNDYVQSVVRAGGIPVVLPIIGDEESVKKQVELLDGVIMMGGHDVDPALYGEEPSSKLGGLYPERDRFDMAVIRAAFDRKIPILGICRGHQIINVAFGGSLYQDLSFIEGCNLMHVQKSFYYEPIHSISIEEDSKLAELVGKEMKVNSFHHLAVKDVAEDFRVVARSKDNVVEAIEYTKDNYIMGVQFHPEMMSSRYEQAQSIFNGFLNAVKENMK